MKKLFAILFLIISISYFNAYAQKDSTKSHNQLNKAIKLKIIEKLNVDESVAASIMSIAKEHKQSMKDNKQKTSELMDEIAANPDSPDMKSKLDQLLDLDYQEYLIKKKYLDNLEAILSPKQIAQLFDFQKELLLFMKKQMKKRDKEDDSRRDFNKNNNTDF